MSRLRGRRGPLVLLLLFLAGPVLAAKSTDPPEAGSLLADLTPEVSAALAAREGPPLSTLSPAEQLEEVFRAGTPYLFEAGALVVRTDSRWYRTRPAEGAGAALLELRRWPGDSAAAFYAVRGPFSHQRDAVPPIPGARLELQPGAGESGAEWRGEIETQGGSRPALWLELLVTDSESFLGALLLPGDAGFGSSGVRDLAHELRGVAGRVGIRREAWDRTAPVAPGRPVQIPVLGATPGDKTEADDPWQVARGTGFTIGLPPGFRARRTDAGVAAPRELPGQRLWLRGRATDLDEDRLAVGDATRAGYVAEVRPLSKSWAEGKTPPLASPEAKIAAAEEFPLVADRTGARSVSAERWSESGFTGVWLVFRLRFSDHGIEIGLPVLEGRRSASMYWIPATWRPADRPPAPPPVDPAARFGIRFERLRPSEQAEQPWTEGYLVVPGLRAQIPQGWYPAASLRSKDGYPIRLVDREGTTLARLSRLDTSPSTATDAGGWHALKKPGRHRAAEAYADERQAFLFVAREGHAFLLEPQITLDEKTRIHWTRLVESVQLLRAERGEDGRGD